MSDIAQLADQTFGADRLNKGQSNSRQRRYGKHGAIVVELKGEKAGTWFDHASGEGGRLRDAAPPNSSAASATVDLSLDDETHGRLQPSRVWDYTDADGRIVGKVARYEIPGDKIIRPWVPAGRRWERRAMPVPRPLYGLQRLLAKPDAVVVVTEGEKACDAAQRMLGDAFVAVTWPGGADANGKADWRPLHGRDCIVWPDNDEPGRKAADKIARALQGLARSVRTVRVSDLPAKADAADVSWSADELLRRLQQPAKKAAESSEFEPRGRSVVDLMAQAFAPISWMLADLIPEGTILVAGKPKSGKSWFVLNLIVAAMLGIEYLRRSVEKSSRALYLALEDNDRRMQSRVRTLMIEYATRLPELAGFEYRCDWPRGLDGAMALDEYLTRHPDCRIVAVDVLAKIRPISDRRGAYEQDYEAVAHWKAIADKHRITLLVVHHTRKAEADDVFDEVSGTLAINGAVDQIVVLKRTPANPKQATLHMRGRDLPEDHELGIELRGGWWHYLGAAAAISANDARREVLDVLRDSDGAMTTTQLLKATGKKSRPSMSRLLSEMAKAGLVERHGRAYSVSGRGYQ